MSLAWCGATDSLPQTLKAAGLAVGLDVGFQWNHLQKASHPNETTFMVKHGLLAVNSRMTMANVQQQQGVFSFAASDEWVAWARRLGMRVTHGGHLVWEHEPSWAIAITSPSELRAVMVDHITTMMAHFGGSVSSWNVVNESISDFGSPNPGDFRSNHWFNILGPSYVTDAFNAAASVALPGQTLVLNQAWLEWADDVSYSGTLALIGDLLNAGVRVDAIGAQFHLRSDQNASASVIVDRLNAFGNLGLDVHITELDVLDKFYPLSTRHQDCADHLLTIVGAVCADVVNLKEIVMWDVCDRTSFLDTNPPYGRSDGMEVAGGNFIDRMGRYNPMADALLTALAMRA